MSRPRSGSPDGTAPGSAAPRSDPWFVAALREPSAYPHPVDGVEVVETHISWVFLAGDRVYKVKKPVDLGFLDFRTLRRRRHFCEQEVRLNRRLAPDTYLGVVALKGTRPRIRFGGRGRTIEVAVEMRRLPAERMLDRLVAEGRAEAAQLRAVAANIARFHAEAETGGRIDQMGSVETIRRNWDECFTQTAETPADVWPPERRRALRDYVDGFLASQASRLQARIAEGRIRDCHGDLQAQHICCIEPIQIFDCIEFNERFRFGDTAGEVAFLAMDLQRLGVSDLALELINAYADETGDYGMVPLLDFYRAYRALVRAKVLAFQLPERPDLIEATRALFALAGRYAEPREPARLLLTSGVMGSGKSTVARAVAARLGAIVIRTDAVRKRLGGVGIHQRATAAFEEGLYTPAMSERTYAETRRLAAHVLEAGWSVVLDGSFSRVDQRDEARRIAQQRGLAHATLWCDAPDAVIAERLARRAAEPLEISDGHSQLLPEHRARYEPPDGERNVVRVETDREPVIDRVAEALRPLLDPR
jgi:aminoglycoside phosphotransferase family enzyme/predicted kinase